MSAIFSYIAHQPWHLILFWSSGVFCFGTVAITTLSSWVRDNTISGKLKLDLFSAIIGIQKVENDEVWAANCSIKIFNKGLYDLYYQLQDTELSLSETTSKDNKIDKTILLIQSGSDMTIGFPTILRIEPGPLEGRVKLTLKYGKSKKSLPYTLRLLGTPRVHAFLNDKGEVIGTLANIAIEDMKYM